MKRKKFIGGDFSNIEGRYNAWMAGEEWKLEAFRAYDRGGGPDLYKVTSAKVLGKDPKDITRQERQESGKVPELSLGFMGGYRALQKMAKKYSVKLTNERAEEIKVGWRGEHPKTVASWKERNDAAIAAVDSQGLVVEACGGKIAYRSVGATLLCRLPSGRVLAYARPEIKWTKKKIVMADGDEIEISGDSVHYYAVDSKTKKWSPQALYGGLLCENDVQGGARDVLVAAMLRIEQAGFEIVMHVHDEITCEVDEDFDDLEYFTSLMAQPVEWAPGLPIAVSPWEGVRYG